MPWKFPIVFYIGSNYDYNFIIKEWTEEFKNQFTGLGENAEEKVIITVPIET